MDRVARILDRLSTAALYAAATGIIAMTLIIGWQIFGRYVLNDTPDWSERLSLFLMNWYILLAAAVGVRQQFHIGLVFFKEALPRRAGVIAEALIHLSVAAFSVAMVIYGAALADTTWSHTIPTLGIGTGWSYLPFPVAGILMILFSADHFVRLFVDPSIAPEAAE